MAKPSAPKVLKKRDRLITRINLSPTKAFSIGASGVIYERRRLPSNDSNEADTDV